MIRDTRIFVEIPASYDIKGINTNCEVIDLSTNGLGIRTRQFLEIGDVLKIKLTLDDKPVEFFTIVRNSNKNGTEYGLEIEELHPNSREILDDYLYKIFNTNKQDPREKIELLKSISQRLNQ